MKRCRRRRDEHRRRQKQLKCDEEAAQAFSRKRLLHLQLMISIISIIVVLLLSGDPTRPIDPSMRLNRNSLGTHNYLCEEMFRLSRDHILQLADALLPDQYVAGTRYMTNNVEGLCVVLRRLAFPSRLGDLVRDFGCSGPRISAVFRATLRRLDAAHGHLLDFDPTRFHHRLAEWAARIAALGVHPTANIALFIDGTLRGVGRPKPQATRLPPNCTFWQLQVV